MLLGPHDGLGDGEVGSVWENVAGARIKQRTREKLSNLTCFFAMNFLSSLKQSSFYLGNLERNLMLLLYFLSCVPICSYEP